MWTEYKGLSTKEWTPNAVILATPATKKESFFEAFQKFLKAKYKIAIKTKRTGLELLSGQVTCGFCLL